MGGCKIKNTMQRMMNFAKKHGLTYLDNSAGNSLAIGCSFWGKGSFVFTDYDDEKGVSSIEHNGTVNVYFNNREAFFSIKEHIDVMELESMMKRIIKNSNELYCARNDSDYRLDLAIKSRNKQQSDDRKTD